MSYTPDQQRFFRDHEGAALVRQFYAFHHSAPGDIAARALLDSAIKEAMRHPEFPRATGGENAAT